ncbi:MAG: glycosyltransferase family 4 protein [Verrucomicrobiota bacterium]
MKIVHLTPGTGNFHCGSCLRDNHLVKALRRMGHDVVMVPLYLPLVTDHEAASGPLPVFAGGINLYLQQKFPIFRRIPRWLHRWLDSPPLLKLAASMASMTSARELGEMTVGSLRGLDGRQADEWQRLIDWIGTEGKPDLVSLSNGLLNGLAPGIRRDLGVPVVCSLQGEDSFLDTLPEPWKSNAWDAFRDNNADVALYIATSDYYRGIMRDRLRLPEEKIITVRNGMDFTGFLPAAAPPEEPVIGFLARLCYGKGLKTLVDAFLLLAPRLPSARLALAGTTTKADEAFISQMKNALTAAGLTDRVTWRENLDFDQKIQHLQSLSVLSVPATYGEAFGLYIIEAHACGIPVVEPDHAGPGELVRATGGGVLCPPDNPAALADALESLLRDEPRRQALAAAGRESVLRDFTADRMARDFEAACLNLLKNT